ncbi:hypothetical protein [uncultured Hymenobacter sp.]|uniref:hypothetical protein n=1 Tax=uncultured Hymenobacter sp. TaxID=170016 RepID=UPI0035C960C1
MKKLLFSSLALSCWLAGAPTLQAQGTLVAPSPGAVPRPPAQPRPVTLDIDAYSRKPGKLKPALKPDKQKLEKKTLKSKAGA